MDVTSSTEQTVVTVLAFISGAIFIFLLVLYVGLLMYRRFGQDKPTDVACCIVYNIEQDKVCLEISCCIVYKIDRAKVCISPETEKKLEHILILDDITGLLPPVLQVLKCVHSLMEQVSSQSLLIRNPKDIGPLERAIRHIPFLLDSAIQTVIVTNIHPPSVDTRIQNLVLGIEQVVGLVSIINLHDNQEFINNEMKSLHEHLETVRLRCRNWRERNPAGNSHLVNIM
ncbi:uncharacterized protein LOC111710924 isoform X1 [Eurytemora carolleeae]|uniref:uncharacterized protein LOC111710924 isoform X1 n=1 Tax=Eurytemora carolleeae TaxID=1294199 RepID=UPI000C76D33B|nr:uncharacterized protein LOC111710924 isoform X1 [Eurytemora carolleeae]XP_023340891.1 uncharacterized protein LOC111710924 isoform X1 [Eurytemora carolleeae]XP_023340892.1 uncharacterized protein LOC111710924 isoform X1 [Eurytemora carolleeae]XP_023340893.1 uncharacterized protein LOC111710924 isoform X1 [Eurytemora carolleeae]|eukprot:XP_023340890.1 uncharacterized protein LOC111710924 isoform X1 [Eurytemora affinis]